jgi:hypothetical protein
MLFVFGEERREGGKGAWPKNGPFERPIRNSPAGAPQSGQIPATFGRNLAPFAVFITEHILVLSRNSPLAACKQRVSRKVVIR